MHGTLDTLTGEEIRDLSEKVHTEIGMGTPFVKIPFEKFGTWTTETWLKMMWKNLWRLDIELLWSYLPYLPIHR